MVAYRSILFILILGLMGCKDPFKNDTLSLPKQVYMGDELKTEGVYVYSDSVSGYSDSFFLYRNGVFLIGEGFQMVDYDKVMRKMSSVEWSLSVKNSISRWGRFIVVGDRFTYEYWMPISGGGYPTYTFDGRILNDTTIQMERMRRSHSKDWQSNARIFHLHKIANKPDSTNRFTN